MSRTLIRQSSQIHRSDLFDDSLAAGVALETSAVTLQDDLNGLRSQMLRLQGGGNWYDSLVGRSVEALGTDLLDLEQKPVLFRAQVLTDITVGVGNDYVILSVAGGEAPSQVAAVGAVTTEGAVVAFNATFGAATLDLVAGPNALSPRNLVIVRNALDSDPILSGGKIVYGLLQSESSTNGAAFDDAANQVQISFVRENAAGTALELVPAADIENFTINYAYARRVFLDNVPQDAFLGGAFVDVAASINPDLQTVINEQGNTPVNSNFDTQIIFGASTYGWDFTTANGGNTRFGFDEGFATLVGPLEQFRIRLPNLGTQFQIDDGAGLPVVFQRVTAEGNVTFNALGFTVNNTDPATFSNELQVGTAGNFISLGAGGIAAVASQAATDLIIDGSLELFLDDSNKDGSTWAGSANGIKLSETTAEWDAYVAQFGSVSLLAGLTEAAAVVNREKGTAVVTAATIAADTDLQNGVNIDAALPAYTAGTFVTNVDVFLNGQLMRGGANAAANNDVYPGTTPASGEIRFEFGLVQDDVVTLIRYGAL